jgi:Domain of unknown function (DUF1707)
MLAVMTQSPDLRAGDQDRDRTIATLREAFAEGRLTQDEFDGRMGQATAARTMGDLAALTVDLPPAPAATPVPVAATVAADVEVDEERDNLRKGWAAWAGVSLMVNVIWLGTWITEGDPTYYWPIWVMGPWGAAMVIGTLSARRR